MNNLSAIATEIFQILRSYDYSVQMWDDDGNAVFEPEDARRLFATPENLTVSILDDNDNSSVRLYLSKSTEVEAVEGLIEALRTCATKYNMVFTNRKYEKDLEPKDFHSKHSVSEGRKMDQLTEGMYGTSRSSYLKLENARMIVRHSAKIDENVLGSRGRHIDSIFCENAQGERFLFPTTQLAPARAMSQHVNQGGSFADDVGQHILRMADDYRNLGACSQFVRHNTGSLNESAQRVREACRENCRQMRKCFERLYRESSYADECSKLKDTETGPLVETAIIEHLRNTLTVEGKELGEAVINSVAKYIQTESFIDEAREAAVPMTSVMGKPVSSAAWADLINGRIDMIAEPNHDNRQPQFRDKEAELLFKLGEIVPNVRDTSMANFLGFVADGLATSPDPAQKKRFKMVALAAVKAAGMVMDEGIAVNNPAIVEFVSWFKKNEPYTLLTEGFGDPSEDDGTDDDVETLVANFRPQDFLATKSEYGSDGVGQTLQKSEVLADLEVYLERELAGSYERENTDLKDAAKEVWDEVADALRNKGFTINDDESEGEENDGHDVEPKNDDGFLEEDVELRREDVLLPKNPGQSLASEVTPKTVTDPETGKEVDAGRDEINKLTALAGVRKSTL